MRKRIGKRRHTARFERYTGRPDSMGGPMYSDPHNWAPVVSIWFCELLTTRGGEQIRGRQVTESTTHVAFGNHSGVVDVSPAHVAVIGGKRYGVVSVFDADGLGQEMRIELRREE